jgi:hypothetical protein
METAYKSLGFVHNLIGMLTETPLDEVFRGQAWSHPEDRPARAASV